MRDRRILILLFLVACLVLPGTANAADTLENMLPKHSPINEDGSVTNELYEKFNVDNYVFDGDYGLTDIFDESGNEVISSFYVAGMFGLKIALYLFQWSIEAPFFDQLAAWVADAVNWMGGHIFWTILDTLSIFISLWILVEVFRRQYADSAKSLLTSLVFLALSMVLFNNMGEALHNINDFSNAASAQILAIVDQGKDSDDVNKEAVVKASNKIWENYAIIPWQFGEFGKSMKPGSEISETSKDPIAKDTYLILSSNDTDRSNYVKQWAEGDKPRYPTLTSDGDLSGRTVVTITTLLTNLIFVIFLVTLSLFGLFYKLAFLILAFMSPLVCLFAAWPRQGVWTVINWGRNWIGAGLYGVVVAFLLAFYLGISTKLYELVPKMGWFFGGVIPQMVLVMMLVMFRKKLIQFFQMPVRQTRNMFNQVRRQIGRGEPFRSQSREFGKQINSVFDQAESKFFGREPAVAGAAASGGSSGSGFSKPYLQKMMATDQPVENQSKMKQQQQPLLVGKKVGEVKKIEAPDVSRKKGQTVKVGEEAETPLVTKISVPDQPQRGRIINGEFIPYRSPQSTVKQHALINEKKKYRLARSEDIKKRKLALEAGKVTVKATAYLLAKSKKGANNE